jgi:hypothetical protein
MKLNLHPGEQLLYTYHESEIVLAKPVLIIFLALYVPWFFALKYDLAAQYRSLLFLWTVVIFLYAAREYIMWSLNRYIITTQRLIRLHHYGVFKKIVIETPLERILNVSYKTTGIRSAVFRYGDVEVQVVGLMEPIILKNIKHPQHIKDYLWQMHQQRAKEQPADGYTNEHIARLQEEAGYTKKNQKVL